MASKSRAEILTAIRDILAEVVEDDGLHLTEQTTAQDVPDWDSINHVNLLLGLESELGFRFSTDEVGGLKSVGELIDVVQAKL